MFITPVSTGVDEDSLSVHLSREPLPVVHGPIAVPVAAPVERCEDLSIKKASLAFEAYL
jgi:hypothetical protein